MHASFGSFLVSFLGEGQKKEVVVMMIWVGGLVGGWHGWIRKRSSRNAGRWRLVDT